MIEFFIFFIFIILFFTWYFMLGFVYRKPLFMVGIGLLFSFIGAVVIASLETMEPLKIFKDIRLSLSVVNYTIAAAGGSLIAGGFMLKAQHAARNERIAAEKNFYLEAKRINDLIESFEKRMTQTDILDVDEFKKIVVDGKVILCEKIQELKDKKKKLDKLEYE